MTQTRLYMLIILVVGLVAFRPLGQDIPPRPTMSLDANNGQVATEEVFSYCWPIAQGNNQCDFAVAPSPQNPITADQGQQLTILIGNSPSDPNELTVTVSNPAITGVLGFTLEPSQQAFIAETLPLGENLIQVDARYLDVAGVPAYVTFVFKVTVVEPNAPIPSPEIGQGGALPETATEAAVVSPEETEVAPAATEEVALVETATVEVAMATEAVETLPTEELALPTEEVLAVKTEEPVATEPVSLETETPTTEPVVVTEEVLPTEEPTTTVENTATVEAEQPTATLFVPSATTVPATATPTLVLPTATPTAADITATATITVEQPTATILAPSATTVQLVESAATLAISPTATVGEVNATSTPQTPADGARPTSTTVPLVPNSNFVPTVIPSTPSVTPIAPPPSPEVVPPPTVAPNAQLLFAGRTFTPSGNTFCSVNESNQRVCVENPLSSSGEVRLLQGFATQFQLVDSPRPAQVEVNFLNDDTFGVVQSTARAGDRLLLLNVDVPPDTYILQVKVNWGTSSGEYFFRVRVN